METVGIETTHNVALEVEVATIVDRGIAVVVDWVVLLGWTFGMLWLGAKLNWTWSTATQVIVFGLPWTFYHLVSETLLDGQSLGKRARHIKVARLDGGQPNLVNYLLRWALRVVDSFCLLGVVVILFNGKGQRLGDIAAGTTVVSLKRRLSVDDTLTMQLPEDHRVTFSDAVRITDAEARLIKEVLANRSEARGAAVAKLDQRFRPLFPAAEGMAPDVFLRTLLKDHLALTSE